MKKFFLTVWLCVFANSTYAEVLRHQETKALMTYEHIRTVLIPEEYAKIIDDFDPAKLDVQLSKQTALVARFESLAALNGDLFAASIVWYYTVSYDGVEQACPGDDDNSQKGKCEVREGVHLFKQHGHRPLPKQDRTPIEEPLRT